MTKKATLETIELLQALCGMVTQYMIEYEGKYAHQCMSAGEDASNLLLEYGLASDDGHHIIPNEKFYKFDDKPIKGQELVDYINGD